MRAYVSVLCTREIRKMCYLGYIHTRDALVIEGRHVFRDAPHASDEALRRSAFVRDATSNTCSHLPWDPTRCRHAAKRIARDCSRIENEEFWFLSTPRLRAIPIVYYMPLLIRDAIRCWDRTRLFSITYIYWSDLGQKIVLVKSSFYLDIFN